MTEHFNISKVMAQPDFSGKLNMKNICAEN
jgi:hypothetical protein